MVGRPRQPAFGGVSTNVLSARLEVGRSVPLALAHENLAEKPSSDWSQAGGFGWCHQLHPRRRALRAVLHDSPSGGSSNASSSGVSRRRESSTMPAGVRLGSPRSRRLSIETLIPASAAASPLVLDGLDSCRCHAFQGSTLDNLSSSGPPRDGRGC
jgi:hypothetical protein